MFTDESLMPFGIHKGEKLANVPASYLFSLYCGDRCRGDLKDYIEDNLDVIKFEMENIKNNYKEQD